MTRWVALSTDVNPHYAVYAPIVVRLWERLGYQPILVRHNEGWDSAFGQLVEQELRRDGEGVRTVLVPRVEPLSIGNTMRVARLAAAAWPEVRDDDLVLTADMDMAPLSRTWFDLPAETTMIVMRADMYGSLPGASALMPDSTKALICGLFRFPLCYVGLSARIWQEILPVMKGDVTQSIRRILHGLRHDSVDYDEATCSARLLLSHRCVGSLQVTIDDAGRNQGHPPRWRQGELQLVPMTDWPKGQPMGMLLGGVANRPLDPNALDFHMPKPAPHWIARVLALYWPEEADWMTDYWSRVGKLTPLGG